MGDVELINYLGGRSGARGMDRLIARFTGLHRKLMHKHLSLDSLTEYSYDQDYAGFVLS